MLQHIAEFIPKLFIFLRLVTNHGPQSLESRVLTITLLVIDVKEQSDVQIEMFGGIHGNRSLVGEMPNTNDIKFR